MDFLINLRNRSAMPSSNKNIDDLQKSIPAMPPNDYGSPSKIIDYLLTKRPILDISKDFSEVDFFQEFLSGKYKNQNIGPDINQFDIKNVTDKFLDLYY
jgi:hypothetical protein